MTPYRGPFCSELTFVPGDHKVEDCVASSGIDIVRAAGKLVPVSAGEREGLRVSSGDTTGGQTLASLQTGITARYGLSARMLSGQTAIESALDAGYGLVVFGWYESIASDPYRWQRAGAFLHAMCFLRNNASSRWRADPLAPPDDKGMAFPISVFRAFANSGGWTALGLLEGSVPPTGGPNLGEPVSVFTYKRGLVAVKAGTPIFDAPDGTRKPIAHFPTDKQVEVVGGISGWRVGIVSLGAPPDEAAWLAVAPPTDPHHIVDLPYPPPTTDCTAVVAAATAPLNAQISMLKSTVADREDRLRRSSIITNF